MKGRIIDIATFLRPNPDGTCEGIIALKSTNEVWGLETIGWKTDSKPTKQEAMGEIISNMELMKTDIERCISLLKIMQQKIKD